jgi:hypothetical protein
MVCRLRMDRFVGLGRRCALKCRTTENTLLFGNTIIGNASLHCQPGCRVAMRNSEERNYRDIEILCREQVPYFK